jgi:hypothetical protein
MAAGELPLWNPYTLVGMPFLAEIQTEVFYLPMTALTLFVRGGHLPVYWLQLVNILHYVLAAAGMYFLARSFGLRSIPAVSAGITYGFSGFMVTHAIHQVILAVVAWYPLAFLLFRKALQSPRWHWPLIAGLILGHSFFAGSPQMSFFFYVFLLLAFLFELLTAHGGRRVFSREALAMTARAAAVVAVSLGIAMVQFLPTRELSELSQRAHITFDKAAEGSLAWSQLLTLMFPKLFGSSSATAYAYWGPGPYWHYWETCIYLGILPLLLAAVSLHRFRINATVAFLTGVSVFALLYSLGGNFVLQRFLFDTVPGFAAFRNPARMGAILALCVSLLAGFGLQHLLHDQLREPDRRALTRIIGGFATFIAGTAVLLLTGILNDVFPFMASPQSASVVRSHLGLSLVFLGLAAAGMLLLTRQTRAARFAAYAVPVLIFADLYVFGASHNTSPQNPEEHFARSGALVKFLRSREGIFRVNIRNADGLLMDRNQGMVDRIFTSEGYTPLAPQRLYPPTATVDQMRDLLNIRFYTDTDRGRGVLTLREREGYLQRAFVVFRTHTVTSEEELTAFLGNPEFDPRAVAVLEEPPPAPLNGAPAPWNAVITAYQHNMITVTVETAAEGMLVLSEAYFPGWTATINGKDTRVYRTDYKLRGVFLPSGKSTVVFRYEPESFRTGGMITLGTLIVSVLGIGISVFSQRRVPATPVAS